MSDNKELDAILLAIASGLSGDPDTDKGYLQAQMAKFSHHPLRTEIIQAIGRALYELLPDDKKKKPEGGPGLEDSGIESVLKEVKSKIYTRDFDTALLIMQGLIMRVEGSENILDDQDREYRDFSEFFEEALYLLRSDSQKEIVYTETPYSSIYLLYGTLLIEKQQYQEAREALKKGMHFNPVSFRLMSEYAETYKLSGDPETFFTVSKEAFKVAFRAADVAACYRNFGYYFKQKALWSEAMACCMLCLQYDRSAEEAQAELAGIMLQTEGKIPQPSVPEIMEYGGKYGFMVGPDPDVVSMAYTYGQQFLAAGNPQAAHYCLSIVYDLTKDPEVGELIRKLEEEAEIPEG